ncbi:TetR family transcriptional regulator [Brevibacillus reuszeri]|uniref:Transcriptional regulator n=1 Tax=Brevibacillus reuszeri TaxID=54915 RepID=A0A0K9Z1K4_9BACL|nr:TetR/AcrR family transcriptional regulator [Brevibacillus reuszeri]KNB74772.1 transcriptional regulator [Brevibacillus reuszeri]MED1859586.1 TetR/AcrR family transcriptional regulator [Brevibacillus reuszeri]GED71914.1 TetR family transcriptional regulator [Brevibacillus reuszeri]
MNGFERRKQSKIEQIYSSSFELFSKYGFQKVSVNEIAQHAKVSPATIYNYFGTKEQLYGDMLMNWMDNQLEQYEEILDSACSFPEKTKEIILLETKNLVILSDRFQAAPFSEVSGLQQMLENYTEQKIKPFFMRFVAAGKQDGYIRKDQTDEIFMLYFTMYKNELGRDWEASNQEGITKNIDHMMELFFYGVVGER